VSGEPSTGSYPEFGPELRRSFPSLHGRSDLAKPEFATSGSKYGEVAATTLAHNESMRGSARDEDRRPGTGDDFFTTDSKSVLAL